MALQPQPLPQFQPIGHPAPVNYEGANISGLVLREMANNYRAGLSMQESLDDRATRLQIAGMQDKTNRERIAATERLGDAQRLANVQRWNLDRGLRQQALNETTRANRAREKFLSEDSKAKIASAEKISTERISALMARLEKTHAHEERQNLLQLISQERQNAANITAEIIRTELTNEGRLDEVNALAAASIAKEDRAEARKREAGLRQAALNAQKAIRAIAPGTPDGQAKQEAIIAELLQDHPGAEKYLSNYLRVDLDSALAGYNARRIADDRSESPWLWRARRLGYSFWDGTFPQEIYSGSGPNTTVEDQINARRYLYESGREDRRWGLPRVLGWHAPMDPGGHQRRRQQDWRRDNYMRGSGGLGTYGVPQVPLPPFTQQLLNNQQALGLPGTDGLSRLENALPPDYGEATEDLYRSLLENGP